MRKILKEYINAVRFIYNRHNNIVKYHYKRINKEMSKARQYTQAYGRHYEYSLQVKWNSRR